MQFGNTADDRQSQAAARLATVVQAVKTAEDGFSFFRGYAGAAIADRKIDLAIGFAHADPYLTAIGRVANGVVDQVADQYAQPLGLPDDEAAGRG